jgi:branched-chain amino acid transport system ATP-binding protein
VLREEEDKSAIAYLIFLLHVKFEKGPLMILQVRGLNRCFGQLAAIKDLSFEVEGGEIFGIAGPNGAGKTTLFNVISGTLRGSGEIIFDGVNINGLRADQICHKGVARTFQVPQLFSSMSMFENVRVGAHFGVVGGRNERKNISEVINFVGLEGKEKAACATLNTLDQKATMLAAALATKPKLLLLDEPMAGLSPFAIRQFLTLFQRINNELGITLIIIEHRMRVLTELCHRLMVLHNGQKISIGPPKEVVGDKRVMEVYLGVSHA